MSHTRRSFFKTLTATAAAVALSRVLPGSLAGAATAAKPWGSGMALDIRFTVATQATGRVKRPYVAVWIEDQSGATVRTLSVWVQQTRRNPRWLAELRRWTRQNAALVETVSSATRNPGSYALVWDGKNTTGALVPQGEYFVCLEATREHGPYSLIREKVTLGSTPFAQAFPSNNDFEAARVQFGKA